MKEITLYLKSVGLAAPGLAGWQSACPILRGDAEYVEAEHNRYKPHFLPSNERRRATDMVRLAFCAAEDAVGEDRQGAARMASVFSSSGGDYAIIDKICQALCEEEKAVSPTQFHNSVHNSAAGYWGIGVGSHLPSVSLSAYDHSFAVGLIESALLIAEQKSELLFVCYDSAPVDPIAKHRKIAIPFGVALLFSLREEEAMAMLKLQLVESDSKETPCRSSALEALRFLNPAARCLPLLEVVAATRPCSSLLQLNNSYKLQLGVSF